MDTIKIEDTSTLLIEPDEIEEALNAASDRDDIFVRVTPKVQQFLMEQKSVSLLTVNQVANRMNFPIPTVYYFIKQGIIKAVKIGGRWRIKETEIHKLLNENEITDQ